MCAVWPIQASAPIKKRAVRIPTSKAASLSQSGSEISCMVKPSPSASKIAQDLQSLSDEDKRAIVDALKQPEPQPAPESERETVS